MKNLLLLLCFCLTTSLYSQESAPKFFKVQGGYFFDGHPRQNFSGFNILNLGIVKRRDNKIEGIDLGLIFFKGADLLFDPALAPQSNWQRNKFSFEFDLYRSIPLLGDLTNGLYFGPMASLGFNQQEFVPINPLSFSRLESAITLGAGFRLDYFLKLNKKLNLVISSKIVLLDFAWGVSQVNNPIITIRQQRSSFFEYNFLRKQFPLMLGLSFPFGA